MEENNKWNTKGEELPHIVESDVNKPTLADVNTLEFSAVWNIIKKWNIDRSENISFNKENYSGASGSDVMKILNALKEVKIQKRIKEQEDQIKNYLDSQDKQKKYNNAHKPIIEDPLKNNKHFWRDATLKTNCVNAYYNYDKIYPFKPNIDNLRRPPIQSTLLDKEDCINIKLDIDKPGSDKKQFNIKLTNSWSESYNQLKKLFK